MNVARLERELELARREAHLASRRAEAAAARASLIRCRQDQLRDHVEGERARTVLPAVEAEPALGPIARLRLGRRRKARQVDAETLARA